MELREIVALSPAERGHRPQGTNSFGTAEMQAGLARRVVARCRLRAVRRRIDLEGCHNFRDLGGYPTVDGRSLRWRLLFRSDALHHLTPGAVARVRDELAVGDLIDLRSTGELRTDGRGLLEREPLRFHHLPLFDGPLAATPPQADDFNLADRYFMMAELTKRPLARVISTLAASPGAAVYYCAAGKDRTGIVSAVLLGLLGVRDEIIVADYAATRENLDAIIDRLMATEGYREMLSVLPPDTLHAEPETMISLLARIRERYGSMRGYAREIGVSDESIRRLESRLLE
jgi:protein-tyrosine phosphatase